MDISLNWFDLSKVMVINEVKVIPRSNCKCLTLYLQVGGGPSTERHSSFVFVFCFVFVQWQNIRGHFTLDDHPLKYRSWQQLLKF